MFSAEQVREMSAEIDRHSEESVNVMPIIAGSDGYPAILALPCLPISLCLCQNRRTSSPSSIPRPQSL
jgi:hypothetical protein